MKNKYFINKINIKLIIVILFLSFSFCKLIGQSHVSIVGGATFTNTSVAEAYEQNKFNNSAKIINGNYYNDFRYTKLENVVELKIDRDALKATNLVKQEVTIKYDLNYYYLNEINTSLSSNNSLNNLTESDLTLSVIFDPAINSTDKEIDIYIPTSNNIHKYIISSKLIVKEIKFKNLNTGVVSTFTNLNSSNNVIPLILTNSIVSEIDENFTPNSSTFSSNSLQLSANINSISSCQDNITFSWMPFTGVKYYELEWCFVDFWVNSKNNYIYNFKNNSTRVQLTNTNFTFPVIYEKGYIIYRIRGIGYQSNSNNWNEIASDWTMPDYPMPTSGCGGNIDLTNIPAPINCNDRYIAIEAFMPNLNWKYSIAFAEDTKHKGVVGYFDGTFKNRQSITVQNSDNTAIVSQVIYDFLGRPAIQPLAVPDLNSSDYCFRPDFNLSRKSYNPTDNLDIKQYNWKDFDIDFSSNCNETKTSEMDWQKSGLNPTRYHNRTLGTGASWYYSEYNPLTNGTTNSNDMYIPFAEGYPFVQMEYTPDNTGRIKRVSGLGKELRLKGSDDNNLSYSNSHETTINYGKPTQSDLYRLFGNDIGNASHYSKNITTDANGQKHVTYYDKYNRVIATALSGDPSGLPYNSLPNNVQQPIEVTDYFENIDKSLTGNSLIVKEEISVSHNGIHEFQYTVTPEIFTKSCMPQGICFTCIYDLSISITNSCGEQMIVGGPITKKVGTINPIDFYNMSCNSVPFQLTPNPLLVNLSEGNYTIEKTLTVNKEAYEYYKKLYFTNNACVKTLEEFVAEEELLINERECNYTCETCEQDKQEYISKIQLVDQRIANYQLDVLSLEQLNELKNELIKKRDYTINLCTEICMPKNTCQIAYESMLRDVMPGGQYALYIDNNSNISFNLKYSILNTGGNSLTSNYDWRHPILDYKNEYNQTELIEIKNGKPEIIANATLYNEDGSTYSNVGNPFVKPQDLKNETDFIHLFNTSWAKSLVQMHPEYECWQKCESINSFYEYDQKLMATETFDEALAKGYLNPINSQNQGQNPNDPNQYLGYVNNGNSPQVLDPIYNSNLAYNGSSLKSLIDAKLHSIVSNNNTTYTAWQMLEIYRAAVDNATSDCSKDLLWYYFRAMYLNAKQEVLINYYDVCSDYYISINNDIKKDRRFLLNLNVLETIKGKLSIANQSLFNGNFQDVYDAISATNTGEIALQCEKTCTDYADEWMNRLSACQSVNPSFVPTNTLWQDVRQALINVCKDGCDESHGHGSSTINPVLTNKPFKSFKEVLEGFNLFQAGVCDDIFIEFPLPYNHDYFAYMDADAKNCACDNSKYLQENIDLKRLECPDYTPEGQPFNDCACNQTNLEKRNLLLSTKDVPVENRCNTCYTCVEVYNAAQNYDLVYNGSVPLSDPKFPTIVTNYLNRFLHLNLTYDDYFEFIAKCYKVEQFEDNRAWDSVFQHPIKFGKLETFIPEMPQQYNQNYLMVQNVNQDLWLSYTRPKIKLTNYTEIDNQLMASIYPQLYEVESNNMIDASAADIKCHCKKILNAWKIAEESGQDFTIVLSQLYPNHGFNPISNAELLKMPCLKLFNGENPIGTLSQDIADYPINGTWTGAALNEINVQTLPNSYFDDNFPFLNDMPCVDDPADSKVGDLKPLDKCACEKLLQFKLDYDLLIQTLPPGTYSSFDDYVKKEKRISSSPDFDQIYKKCLEYYQTSLGEDDNGVSVPFTTGSTFNSDAEKHLKKDAPFWDLKIADDLLCNPCTANCNNVNNNPCSLNCNDIRNWLANYLTNNPIPNFYKDKFQYDGEVEKIFLMWNDNKTTFNPEAEGWLTKMKDAFNTSFQNNNKFTRCRPFNYDIDLILGKLGPCMPPCPDLTCEALNLALTNYITSILTYNINNPNAPKYIPETFNDIETYGYNMAIELLNAHNHDNNNHTFERPWAQMNTFINDFINQLNTDFSRPPFCTRNFNKKYLADMFRTCSNKININDIKQSACKVCYRMNIDIKLDDFQAYLNQIVKGDGGATNSGYDKFDMSNWKLRNLNKGIEVTNYYDAPSTLYAGKTDKDNLKYYTAGYPLPPAINAWVKDKSGHELNYNLYMPGANSWLHWGEIIEFSNIHIPPPPPCMVPEYFEMDAVIWMSMKEYDYFNKVTGIVLNNGNPIQIGKEKGFKHTIKITGNFNNVRLAFRMPCPGPCLSLCNRPIQAELVLDDDCEENQKVSAYNNAQIRYTQYIKEKELEFEDEYYKKCLGAVESFKSKYSISEYHYTLYYYDRAGLLTKTVPPQGVDYQLLSQNEVTDRINNARNYDLGISGSSFVQPDHNLITHRVYNSIGQLTKIQTPDAGISKFWYDKLGKLVASQNAEQYKRCTPSAGNVKSFEICTYSKFDDLGRIKETGEKQYNIVSNLWPTNSNALSSALFAGSTGFINTNFYNTGVNTEVTRSYYDDKDATDYISWNNIGPDQNNLRKRIIAIANFENGTDLSPISSTHFNYDIHGNVKKLWQNIFKLSYYSNQQIKTIEYEYDLMSGNTNKVIYQREQPDQFIHQFKFDTDNKLTQLNTSRDGYIWQTDVKYNFSKLGSLNRTVIGDKGVQGIDYAFTLQGWLKNVNSDGLNVDRDMGKDGGNPFYNNQNIARDAYGFSLQYFDKDYISSNLSMRQPFNSAVSVNNNTAFGVSSDVGNNVVSLYNGNISHMVTTLPDANLYNTGNVIQASPLATTYHYDQLNRLNQVKVFDNYNTVNNINTWGLGQNGLGKYAEEFNYDANGNIKSINRNGDNVGPNLMMDELDYKYNLQTVGGKQRLQNNRLYLVDDNSAISSNYTIDVDDQGIYNSNTATINTANNYGYNEKGDLIRDNSEQIAEIKWNLQGKVKEIIRSVGSNKSDLEFGYNAMGLKIYKIEKPKNAGVLKDKLDWITTYYVHDGSGSIVSTYKETYSEPSANEFEYKLELQEQNILAASRIGINKSNQLLEKVKFQFNLNTTKYTNHLPNLINTNPVRNITNVSFDRFNFYLGNKEYELSNHIGNVLATVSDRKIMVDDGTYANGYKLNNTLDNLSDYYHPEYKNFGMYYAFGSPLPGRNYVAPNNTSYRYGFNGEEKLNEKGGEGNSYDLGARFYESRLGRMLSIDPLSESYPYWSPYSYCANSPIFTVDINGMGPADEEPKDLTKVIVRYPEVEIGAGYKIELWRYDPKSRRMRQSIKESGGVLWRAIKARERQGIYGQLFETRKETRKFTPIVNNYNFIKPLEDNGPCFLDKLFLKMSGRPGDEEWEGQPKWMKEGTYQPPPDGMEVNINGSFVGYYGAVNLTFLKQSGLGLNLSYGGQLDLTSYSLGVGISSIEFQGQSARNFSTLEGNGFDFGFSPGPVGYSHGRGYSSHLNDPKNELTVIKHGISIGLKSKHILLDNINKFSNINIAGSNTVTTSTFVLININK